MRSGSLRRSSVSNRTWLALLVLAVWILPACVGKPPTDPSAPSSQRDQQGEVYVGLASYYGDELAGEKTAGGDPYDPNKLTAAHRTLPLGTKVKVTNLENERSVEVTITDRGPSRADRIIDVSLAAARELNMLASGVVKVRVEVIYE